MSVWCYDTWRCEQICGFQKRELPTLLTQSEVFTSLWHGRKNQVKEIHPLGVVNNALNVLVSIHRLLRHSVWTEVHTDVTISAAMCG